MARCAAVIVAHWLAWEIQRTAPKTTDMETAATAVRQVEGSVRSFVHSDLRVQLGGELRTGGAGAVK